MPNLFKGFRLFEKADKPEGPEDEPESMVDITKKQFGIDKKTWIGMPLMVSNTKLGKHMIRQPTMFYVSEFDDDTVTLTNVLDPTDMGDEDDDEDDEIDLDRNDLHDTIEITISKSDFYELQKPQGMQPAGAGLGGGMI